MKSKRWFVAGLVIGCLVGCLIGSYLEYTRTTVKQEREVLKEYRDMKAAFPITDAELRDIAKKGPQVFDDLKRHEEMAAIIALSAFRNLAKGNVEDAKAGLLRPIDLYYSLYHEKGGDHGLLDAIETAGKEFPDIAAVIAKKK